MFAGYIVFHPFTSNLPVSLCLKYFLTACCWVMFLIPSAKLCFFLPFYPFFLLFSPSFFLPQIHKSHCSSSNWAGMCPLGAFAFAGPSARKGTCSPHSFQVYPNVTILWKTETYYSHHIPSFTSSTSLSLWQWSLSNIQHVFLSSLIYSLYHPQLYTWLLNLLCLQQGLAHGKYSIFIC